jgi:Spermine/spermidine synthase domain
MPSRAPAAASVARRPAWLGRRGRLVLASFLMLFVELALIRWSASNVVYLAYFTNFVLLASFLGIGVGFLRARAARDLSRWAPVVIAGFALFIVLCPVQVGRYGGDARLFVGLFGAFALPPWIELPVIFLGAVVVMALVAEVVARLFVMFPPLEAYRLDILGSIAGIVVFSAMSFLGARPLVWAVVVSAGFAVLLGRDMGRWSRVALAAIVVLLGIGSFAPNDTWSPYYRVTAFPTQSDGSVRVRVNGLPHQSILPLELLRTSQPFYLYPYQHLEGNPLDDVLIVGAGTGNDVAVALAEGAKHVDAVEIDPVLQATGRERHPNHPYQDPRVTAYVNDGRAFLERTDTRYDLIAFALPDSLTLVSGQGSLRLESYLFTQEAFAAVREHLKEDGAFTMYNYYRPFVFDRYAGTLQSTFGHAPCFDPGEPGNGDRSQAVLTIGRRESSVRCDTPWHPTGEVPEPATDDHPFPYVRGRSIPMFYAVSLALILLAAAAVVRFSAGSSLVEMRRYLDLFFMGAAFLLLETKNVVQFALLFGTTWFVNSLVFAGILLSVLAAVEVARRTRLPRPIVLYGGLVGSLGVAWVVRPDALLSLVPAPRFAAATVIAFAPVFLANLIFSQRFKDVGSSAVAFGANLLGAMVGGVLEYGAIVVGYRDLLVVVAILYGLAYIAGRRHLRRPTPRVPGAGGEVRAAAQREPA